MTTKSTATVAPKIGTAKPKPAVKKAPAKKAVVGATPAQRAWALPVALGLLALVLLAALIGGGILVGRAWDVLETAAAATIDQPQPEPQPFVVRKVAAVDLSPSPAEVALANPVWVGEVPAGIVLTTPLDPEGNAWRYVGNEEAPTDVKNAKFTLVYWGAGAAGEIAEVERKVESTTAGDRLVLRFNKPAAGSRFNFRVDGATLIINEGKTARNGLWLLVDKSTHPALGEGISKMLDEGARAYSLKYK